MSVRLQVLILLAMAVRVDAGRSTPPPPRAHLGVAAMPSTLAASQKAQQQERQRSHTRLQDRE